MPKLIRYNVLVDANKSVWWEIEDEVDAMWRHEVGKGVD